MKRSLAFAVLVLALGPNQAPGGDSAEEALAQDAARRNRAAVEAIHTLSCTYSKAQYDGSGKLLRQLPETRYWRSGTSFRAKWKRGDQWCDSIVEGLTMHIYSNQVKANSRNRIVTPYHGFPLSDGDPWLDPQLMFVGDKKANPNSGPVTFTELLLVPRIKVTARQEKSGEKSFVVVEIVTPSGAGRGEYWFDPAANYLLAKSILTIKGSASGGNADYILQMVVDKFVEPAPGVYFPAAVTVTDLRGGTVVTQDKSQITDVRVNAPLPTGIFSLDLAPNDRVLDYVDGSRYTVAADGKTHVGVSPIQPLPPVTGEVEQLTETKKEPRSFAVWLIPPSVLLIVVGLVIGYCRRSRDRSPSQPK